MRIDKNTSGYKELTINYQQILDNTENDHLLNDALVSEFSDYLSNYNGIDSIERFCEDFYRYKKDAHKLDIDLDNYKYKFLGKLEPNDDLIFFGHVELRNTFQRNLSSVLTVDFHEVDDIITNLTKGNDAAFASFIKASGIFNQKIRQLPLWSFKSLSIRESAFKLLSDVLIHLPGILGLDNNYSSKEWIAFGYTIPTSIEIKKPTAFDAELHIHWRPGGLTLNICRSSAVKSRKGLEELVSHPIFYDNINTNLISL